MLIFELSETLSPLAYDKVGEWMEKAEYGKYEIIKYKEKRSIPQNSYLHWLFGAIAKEVGEEPDYIKDVFKRLYLKAYSSKGKEYGRSTSSLNTKDFGEFVDKILNKMALMGHTYPTPDDRKAGKRFTD